MNGVKEIHFTRKQPIKIKTNKPKVLFLIDLDLRHL